MKAARSRWRFAPAPGAVLLALVAGGGTPGVSPIDRALAAQEPVGESSPVATDHPTADPTLDDVLTRAGAYVRRFEQVFSGIVAEEHFVQTVLDRGAVGRRVGNFTRRELRSDFLLVRAEGSNLLVPFRDVFEVNGQAVRERENRLLSLFVEGSRDPFEQARRVTDESARFNIGPVARTINVPTLALQFLDPDNQRRSAFSRSAPSARDEAEARGRLWVVEFEEISIPTLVRTDDDRSLPALGRFWIEPGTGRVTRSEVELDSDQLRSELTMAFVEQDGIDVLVPGTMTERYDVRGYRIEGEATYSRLRRFQVTTSEVVDDDTLQNLDPAAR